ncbi:unnamed protein product [Cuscuta campestris]|uniref:Uncharacterized protein n=1 Tax=Cuscuta campestris TaxID=132261 RepID=A0A484NAM9_9ASTE|nr:unnamed protein product [Cuscuta campestris]
MVSGCNFCFFLYLKAFQDCNVSHINSGNVYAGWIVVGTDSRLMGVISGTITWKSRSQVAASQRICKCC